MNPGAAFEGDPDATDCDVCEGEGYIADPIRSGFNTFGCGACNTTGKKQ